MRSAGTHVALSLLVACFLTCSDRLTSLSNAPELAALRGLCLELREDLVFWGGDENGVYMLRTNRGRRDLQPGEGTLPAGSHVLLDDFRRVDAFDGVYFLARGTAQNRSGDRLRVDAGLLLDEQWQVEVSSRISRGGRPAAVHREALPIDFTLVQVCP
jgi:hypothetical protein